MIAPTTTNQKISCMHSSFTIYPHGLLDKVICRNASMQPPSNVNSRVSMIRVLVVFSAVALGTFLISLMLQYQYGVLKNLPSDQRLVAARHVVLTTEQGELQWPQHLMYYI